MAGKVYFCAGASFGFVFAATCLFIAPKKNLVLIRKKTACLGKENCCSETAFCSWCSIMAEQYKPADILQLLDELAEHTNTGTSFSHFETMFSEIKKSLPESPPFNSGDYLYRKLFRRAKLAEKKRTPFIRLNAQNIETIARFLGYQGYKQFLKMEHPDKDPVMASCAGTWYSYVRCNSGNPDILVSPVEISTKGKEVVMKLKGPGRIFHGQMSRKGNCLYCNLDGGNEKKLNLIFKLGSVKHPDVLQGVFSGVSSGGDPIAGREVLIRKEIKFELMKNQKIDMTKEPEERDDEMKLLYTYFGRKENTILKGGRSSTFTLSDLNESA